MSDPAYVAALKRERAAMVLHGKTDRVKDIDAVLAVVDPQPAAAPAPPPPLPPRPRQRRA